MSNESIAYERSFREESLTKKFLETPNEDWFADLFKTFTPQLVAFFRARSCDLAWRKTEVMRTVYRKASQIRDAHYFVHDCSKSPVTLSAGTTASSHEKWTQSTWRTSLIDPLAPATSPRQHLHSSSCAGWLLDSREWKLPPK